MPLEGSRFDVDPLLDDSERVRADSQRLRGVSDQIIAAIDRLKEMELAARRIRAGTAEFESLSEDIATQSREVFRLAHEQVELASGMEPQDRTIEETPTGNAEMADA